MKEFTGCMVFVVIAMLILAAGLIVGHFFGFAIGLASTLVLAAVLIFYLACAYYKAKKQEETRD